MNNIYNKSLLERKFEIKLTRVSGKLMSYPLCITYQGSLISVKCQSNSSQDYFLFQATFLLHIFYSFWLTL